MKYKLNTIDLIKKDNQKKIKKKLLFIITLK